MAHCNLCNKNTRCSCKGGGCPNCNSTNKQIAFLNELLKFGLDKQYILSNLEKVRGYTGSIDTYTAYEYFTNAITEEEFNAAIEEQKSFRKKKSPRPRETSEIRDVSNKVNPNSKHKFNSPSAWARCEYCWGIRKYVEGDECPAYKGEKQGNTDARND